MTTFFACLATKPELATCPQALLGACDSPCEQNCRIGIPRSTSMRVSLSLLRDPPSKIEHAPALRRVNEENQKYPKFRVMFRKYKPQLDLRTPIFRSRPQAGPRRIGPPLIPPPRTGLPISAPTTHPRRRARFTRAASLQREPPQRRPQKTGAALSGRPFFLVLFPAVVRRDSSAPRFRLSR